MGNEQLNEQLKLVAVISPQTLIDASASTGWVSLAEIRRILFTVLVGETDTTVDARVQAATDASGSGAIDLPGKAIAQLGAPDAQKQAQIEVSAPELSRYSHVRLTVAAGEGATGATVAASGYASSARFAPASQAQLATVVETVA